MHPYFHTLTKFWAKTGHRLDNGEFDRAFHPLICHLIDVACVAMAMWDAVLPSATKERLARAFGLDPDSKSDLADAGRLIAFIAGLHDLGKCSPPFQLRGHGEHYSQTNKLLELFRNTKFWCGSSVPAFEVPHGYVTAVELPLLLQSEPFNIPPILAKSLSTLIGGHHGIFPSTTELSEIERDEKRTGDVHWKSMRAEFVLTLAELLEVAPLEKPELAKLDNGTIMILAGLVSVADWIGSNTDFFDCAVDDYKDPKLSESRTLETYFEYAQQRANKALQTLGWLEWPEYKEPKKFEQLFNFEPRGLQQVSIDITKELNSAGIVVIESPMGEGKTEAAMYLADHFNTKLHQRGIYFALPTMATSDQMFGRVKKFFQSRFGGSNDNVQLMLAHGHAALSAEFQLMKDSFNTIEGIFEECSGKDCMPSVVAAEWFTRRKHSLLPPFGVGTIDQILMAVLQTKHVFVRLFGLAHKTIIIDEVHAYDAYMSTLLERLLEWLAALGSPVILLSATLPCERRTKLIEAYQRGLNAGVSSPHVSEGISVGSPHVSEGISVSSPHVSEGISVSSPHVSEGISVSSPHVSEGISVSSPHVSEGISVSSPHVSEGISVSNPHVSEGISVSSPHVSEGISVSNPHVNEGSAKAETRPIGSVREHRCESTGLDPQDHYPRISYATDANLKVRHIDMSTKSSTLFIKKVEDEEFIANLIARLKIDGGCVAIICNTVARAQDMFEKLAKDDFFSDAAQTGLRRDAVDGQPVLNLLHSRFRYCDRETREKHSLIRFGKPDGKVSVTENGVVVEKDVKRPHTAVLVSTQIIEQSLDLDFDLMISDLAPIDLLLQRAGRLQRHDRESKDIADADRRPATFLDTNGKPHPELWIIDPSTDENGHLKADQNGLPDFGDAGFIYDHHILLRTWLELQNINQIKIPIEIEDLIEAVYRSMEPPTNLSEVMIRYWYSSLDVWIKSNAKNEGEAEDRLIQWPGYKLHVSGIFKGKLQEDSPEINRSFQAVTRLTRPTANVICLSECDKGIFMDENLTCQIDLLETPTDDLAKELLRRSVGVSFKSVVFGLIADEIPKGWLKSPYLRHYRVLKFNPQLKCEKFGHSFTLDSRLGLIITGPN